MAFVVKFEELSGGKAIRSGELWRDDGAASTAGAGVLGLRLADAKTILARLQVELVALQVRQACEETAACQQCGTRRQIKDYRPHRLDTLFGRLTLRLPRRGCPCCKVAPTIDPIFASRATPELTNMQAKLAAHLPYRVAGRLLADLLPLHAGISHTVIRSRTMAVARRLVRRPAGQSPAAVPSEMIVTVDGAFIRAVPSTGVRHMQVVVGSIERPRQRRTVFAAVGAAGISVGNVVKAHLRELDASTITRLTVLTDGEEGLHNLVQGPGGNSALPILDWFHLAMRLQHVKQTARSLFSGLPSYARAKATIQMELERLHWRLWHGKPHAVQTTVDRLTGAIRTYKFHHHGRREARSAARKVWTLLLDLRSYTSGLGGRLVNYGARYRAGQRVSTSVVESMVNSLVNRRMNKRQQMRWSPAGAHYLLQVRAALFNDTFDLAALPEPGTMEIANDNRALHSAV